MSDSILPADWPHSADSKSVSRLLSGYSGTKIFTKATQSVGTQPLKFYLSSFNNKRAIVEAIKNNGGTTLQHKYIGKADIIIKPTLTQIDSFSAVGVVCTPHLILRSLQAGRMLDTEDYLLEEEEESDESEESESGESGESEAPGSEESDESGESEESKEFESGVANGQLATTPHVETRSPSEEAANESESSGGSQQTVETPKRRQQQQQSRLSLTPASSAIGDIRYLYADNDELDPDDRYVDDMLSLRSRSIEDLVTGTADSPDSQNNRSADISDNDFRVKTKLDAAARDPREMLDLALTDSPADSLANSPTSSVNHSPQFSPNNTADSQRIHEQEGPDEYNLALRTPSPQPPTAERVPSPIPQQTPSRSMFERIKSVFLSSQSIIPSPSSFSSRKSPKANGSKSRSPIKPAALNTQFSQGSWASSSLSMEGTPERSASPELVMPPTQAPLSPAFAYIESPEDAPTSSRSEASPLSQEIGLELSNPPDGESRDPNPLMGSGVLRSESPELSSLPSISSKAKPVVRDTTRAKPSTPYPTTYSMEEELTLPPAAPTAVWTGLGKRRRTSDRDSGYGHRPTPVVVVGSDDNEPTSPESSGQSLFLSQERPPPVTNKSQSVDNIYATPTGRRVRMRVVPFSPSKRIRMSTLESPEATSANATGVLQPMSDNGDLAATTISTPEAAATIYAPEAALNSSVHTDLTAVSPVEELARLTQLSRAAHMEAAAPQVNGQLSSSQLPSLAPISGITDTAADNVADHEAQANSEPDRPRMTTMTTDSTSSTVSTPVLDSSLRHESDVEEPEVEAVAPSSEPLIISGLFANEGAAAGLRLNIPCGEITADTLDAPQSQPVPESPSHHSDNSGAASDADDPDAMDVVNIDAENDADDDESDVEIKDAGDIEQAGVSPSHMLSGELTSTARNTPEACVEPAAIQGEKEEESRRHTELLDHSQRVEDGDAFWRIEDVEEPLKLGSEHTPRNGSHQGRAWPATSQTFKSPARMANGNARTPEAISKSQPRATRSRRASTARVVSMCQRLLTLHKLGDNDGRLGLQLGDGLLSSRTVLGSDALESSRLASHDFSNAPSPARRAQFSGAMRVFGDNAPEMNDSERLAYLRKLKGLMVDTSLTPKQAMAILYRCTGDWVIARKFIISGEASVPSGRMWSAEDDQALQQGMDLDKMEELRQQKGNVEVYRRLQFLNTFHGPKE